MDTITVDKAQLIETLRTNRTEHDATYEAALVAFQERAVQELSKMLKEARKGDVRLHVSLPVPEKHTEDFDRVIEMLEWDQGSTVRLTHSEFAQYVQNKWGWIGSFTSNTSSYTAGR